MATIFEATTCQTHSLKQIFDTLNCLVTDYNIIITPPQYKDKNSKEKKLGGIYIREVNPAETVFIHCKLDADKFEEYKYNYTEDKLIVGINSTNLLKCIKCMSGGDTMTWRIYENNLNKLEMTLKSEKDTKIFRINLMDIDYREINLEDIEPDYMVSLPSQEFQSNCKNISTWTEIIDIKCNGKNVILSGDGEIGDFDIILNEQTDGLTIRRCKKKDENQNLIVQGLYELKYITIFTKCTSLSDYVTFFLRNDYPIIIEYEIKSVVHDDETFGILKLVLSQNKPNNLY